MTNEPELMTEYLPQVRCTKSMKMRLEAIAETSVAPALADHIRFALDQYIAAEEAKNAGVASTPARAS